MLRIFLTAAALTLAAQTAAPAASSTPSVPLGVAMNVQGSCTLNAPTGTFFNFGNVNANSTAQMQSEGTLSYSCSASAPSLGLAESSPSNTSTFTMKGTTAGNSISFKVCNAQNFTGSTAPCTSPGDFINNPTAGDSQVVSPTAVSVSLIAYFTPPNPFPVDTYSDTIDATLYF